MRIAIVEDNEVFQVNYVEWLQNLFPAAQIDQFTDATPETGNALQVGAYELIILDIQLGERRLGGRTLAAGLKAAHWPADSTKPIVIVLTATIEPELVPTIEAQGVALVRGKPLSRNELKDVLARIDELAQLMVPQAPALDGLRLDLSALRDNVSRHKLKARLSAVPLRILDRLLRRSGEVVRYEEFDGCSSAPLSKESIHQHIRVIRDTLEPLYSADELQARPMNQRLVSIEKQGYSWRIANDPANKG